MTSGTENASLSIALLLLPLPMDYRKLSKVHDMTCPPDWMSEFLDAATESIHAHDILSPLGCHFYREDEIWEITLFASQTEIVGGPQDGSNYSSGFNIDVLELTKLFSSVESVSWQSQALEPMDELGNHLSVEGTYEGNHVWLRITSKAPERFEIGRRVLVHKKKIEVLW